MGGLFFRWEASFFSGEHPMGGGIGFDGRGGGVQKKNHRMGGKTLSPSPYGNPAFDRTERES